MHSIEEVVMLVIAIASLAIPLIVKNNFTGWKEIIDYEFPKTQHYSLTIKFCAFALLSVIFFVIYSLVTEPNKVSPKDFNMLLYSPVLLLPCLIVLSPQYITDHYFIPLIKILCTLLMSALVIYGYYIIFRAISSHYVPAKGGYKYGLEKDAGRFWFGFIGFSFTSGLFLYFLKGFFISSINHLSDKEI
jgi:hypothetical protein